MVIGFFLFVFNIIALISQYSRYKRLGRDAEWSEEPEEIAALKSAQQKAIPNMVFLIIALISLVFLFCYISNSP